jgi:hypothetical protein
MSCLHREKRPTHMKEDSRRHEKAPKRTAGQSAMVAGRPPYHLGRLPTYMDQSGQVSRIMPPLPLRINNHR